ncbi:hypothetical protein TRFO_22336 [Tritrichomonas foetus]|uniref:Uncharacterized protein n=1 Tax=Tritrichomonas foetus TaxID=1144522 RepID=A0A1J4KDD9_9EUKA|nr:hypothetical protein TRFO_22336 [Tritrichomonas foetus]|eukprot:OHT08928.1 hypothetical protein TRFO_22336 [Tritrichomonas foetus]
MKMQNAGNKSNGNKMVAILDQIRERYAPPPTEKAGFPVGGFLAFVVVAAIIGLVIYTGVTSYKSKGNHESDDEKIPFKFSQLDKAHDDLSVHGFSKL